MERRSNSNAVSGPPWALAVRLAIGQLVAWGTLFYAFSIVVGPMHSDTGWSRPLLNAGLSLGLLCWGIAAIPVGAWLRRYGGRALMGAASFSGGLALVLLGNVSSFEEYFLVWMLLGVSMAGLLYEPAFAVVSQAFGPHYRKGITLITLIAGFASTVFIPLSQAAVDHLGWKNALMALGALQICVGVPLHILGLPKSGSNRESVNDIPARNPVYRLGRWMSELRNDIRDPRFLGLAVWFTAHSAAFSGMTFLLVPILQNEAVNSGTIVKAIMLIGPMQVIGRLLLASRADQISVLKIGPLAMCSVVLAVSIVLMLPHELPFLALFAIFYGAGNGIMTILRGTAVAELFGLQRYAEINGALTAPVILAQAISPVLLATLWTVTGHAWTAIAGILALLLLGAIGLLRTRNRAS